MSFYCEKCDFSCEFQSVYDKHCKSNKHLGVKKEKNIYHCEKCNFNTLYPSLFDVHCLSKKHNQDKVEVYRCECCSYTTKVKVCYDKHIASVKHIEMETGIVQHKLKRKTNVISIYHKKIDDDSFELTLKIRNEIIRVRKYKISCLETYTFEKLAKIHITDRYYNEVSTTNHEWFKEWFNLDDYLKLVYVVQEIQG